MMSDFGKEWDDLMGNYVAEQNKLKTEVYQDLIKEISELDNTMQVIGLLHNKIEAIKILGESNG